jgi:aminoglycoside phosphotransferase (APT) family kinase protein
MTWLADHMPDDAGSCVIHNDFRLDNLVLSPADPLRIAGVLDWELATIGDPLMDLGSSLAYWVQADDDLVNRQLRRQPTHLPGMMTRRQVIEYYAEQTGRSLENWTFYQVFGLFRLAVIVQQIYYRYHHKQSTNPAFKNYWFMVCYLDWRCRRLIKRHV